MAYDELLAKCKSIAEKYSLKGPAWRRTSGMLPSLAELIGTCSELCRTYKDWYELMRLGARIRLPMEFLNARQTELLFEDAREVAHASSMPAYLLLRTYDVDLANRAIQRMLGLTKQAFEDLLPNLNILIGIVDPTNPLFQMVEQSPVEHELMVRMNTSWFVRSNEAYFRYRDKLLLPIVQTLKQHKSYPTKEIRGVATQAYSLEHYIKRMDGIVDRLKSHPLSNNLLSEFQKCFSDEAKAHRSREAFVLHTANRGSIHIKPIDAFLDSKEFFPVLIFYHVLYSKHPNRSVDSLRSGKRS